MRRHSIRNERAEDGAYITGAVHAVVRKAGRRYPVWSFGFYLLLALWVQRAAGAWDASFASYPDEPSHFVSSVMVHDYFTHHLFENPLQFAREYYRHYPFFAVGYWPPLFYAMAGIWFILTGVGRFQALLLIGVIATVCAWLVSMLVRRQTSDTAAFCAGLVFLTLPEVQLWYCAVMVDQTVVLFSLVALLFAIRYFERPRWPAAAGFSVCAAMTVLTKYSGLYVCGLMLAAAVVLRRFRLFRSAGFLAHPAICAALVAPWVLWTARLATTGLPAQRQGTLWQRSLDFVRESFLIFPPALLVLVILGLVALAAFPRLWRPESTIVLLYAALLIGFMVISPVGPERRYLQGAAAAFLVLSCCGWWRVLSRWAGSQTVLRKLPAPAFLLTTVILCSLQILRFRHPPHDGIAEVVRAVTERPDWEGKRILAAPDMEGPVIAEFAAQDKHRPGYWLVRPSKRFARLDWFGGHYESRFSSTEELMGALRSEPVDLLIWHETPAMAMSTHERLMQEMLAAKPLFWRRIGSFGSWSLFECVGKT